MKISKGDKFLCIEDVRMIIDGELSNEIAYLKGEVYTSEYDWCITDECENVMHTWSGDEETERFFKPYKEDPIVQSVIEDLKSRSQVGLEKYGVGLDRKDLTTRDFIQHAYEEALDLANYLKRVLTDMDSNNEENLLSNQGVSHPSTAYVSGFSRPTLTVDQLLNRDEYDEYNPDTEF